MLCWFVLATKQATTIGIVTCWICLVNDLLLKYLCWNIERFFFRCKISIFRIAEYFNPWFIIIMVNMIKEMFYLMMHSTHFIYGYMASDIWLRIILIVSKETCCCHIGYSFRLAARVLLCVPSRRQDITYHGLCYTSRGVLAGTRNSSMGSPHEGSIRRPIAPWTNALTTELHLAPLNMINFFSLLLY